MSWKYPFSQLTEGGVVEIDGLNRGFLQAVNEVQGQLNEHNWEKGAVSSIIRAPTASTNPSLWNPTLRLNFTDNRFLNEDAFFAYVTPTHGSSIGENTVVNAGSGDAGTTPNLDTGGPPVPWLTVGTNNQVGWAGAWPVPADGRWHTMSEAGSTPPCALQFFLTSETQIYILLSFQWLGLRESAGSMFGIKINGNLITESIIGSGDLQIEPYSRVGDIPGAAVPNPERMEAAPAPCPSSRLGYPFCAEAIVTAPPGVVTVEAVVRRAASDLVPNAIGSRELIVLKLAR